MSIVTNPKSVGFGSIEGVKDMPDILRPIENNLQRFDDEFISKSYKPISPFQERFRKEDGSIDNQALDAIIYSEHNRDGYGNWLDLRYKNYEEVLADIAKMEELYSNFPGFAYYNQNLYLEPFGDSTVKECGCCQTSLAMVLTYILGEHISPLQLLDVTAGYYVKHEGTDVTWGCYEHVAEVFNVNTEMLDIWNDYNSITDALEHGKPIVLACGPGTFTGTGHYIVLLGLTEDGRIIVADPNSIGNSTKTYSIEEMYQQIKQIDAAAYAFSK